MQVNSVTVRYMRRAQIKDYEPVEAEVSLSAQLAEGEGHVDAVNSLMKDAKKAVIESGLKSGKSETTVETGAATKPAEPPKQTRKAADKPAETKKEEPKAAPAADPADPSGAPAEEPAAAAAEPDEFAEFDAGPAAAPAAITVKELTDWVTASLKDKSNGITPDEVKAVYAKFGAARTADLKDDDRPKAKVEIEALIKSKKKA